MQSFSVMEIMEVLFIFVVCLNFWCLLLLVKYEELMFVCFFFGSDRVIIFVSILLIHALSFCYADDQLWWLIGFTDFDCD